MEAKLGFLPSGGFPRPPPSWTPGQAFREQPCTPARLAGRSCRTTASLPSHTSPRDLHPETLALTHTCEGPWGAQPGVGPLWELGDQ